MSTGTRAATPSGSGRWRSARTASTRRRSCSVSTRTSRSTSSSTRTRRRSTTPWVRGPARTSAARPTPRSGRCSPSSPPSEIDDAWVEIVIPHELTHLVFDTAVDNPYHFPPRWLNEGLGGLPERGLQRGRSERRGGRDPGRFADPAAGPVRAVPDERRWVPAGLRRERLGDRLLHPDPRPGCARRPDRLVRGRQDRRRGVPGRDRTGRRGVQRGLAGRSRRHDPGPVRTAAGSARSVAGRAGSAPPARPRRRRATTGWSRWSSLGSSRSLVHRGDRSSPGMRTDGGRTRRHDGPWAASGRSRPGS